VAHRNHVLNFGVVFLAAISHDHCLADFSTHAGTHSFTYTLPNSRTHSFFHLRVLFTSLFRCTSVVDAVSFRAPSAPYLQGDRVLLSITSIAGLLIVSAGLRVFEVNMLPDPLQEVVFNAWRKLNLNTEIRRTGAVALQSVWRYRAGMIQTSTWTNGSFGLQYRPVSKVRLCRCLCLATVCL
jgi:hypothetical protein